MFRTLEKLQSIPNIGLRVEFYLNKIGITKPSQLVGKDPYKLYEKINKLYGRKFDPCLLDVFISAVRFMNGEPVRKWWYYTKERKIRLK